MPIYLQVADNIKKQIILGKYKPGERLPSTKALAVLYNVNPNTAVRIYQELESQDITFIKRGLGTFVTESGEVIEAVRKEMANAVIDKFIGEMVELGFGFEEMHQFIKGREV